MPRQIKAFAITFKRKRTAQKKDGWEMGIFIGKDETDEGGQIYDMNGAIVKEVYDYHDRLYDGCIVVREYDKEAYIA